MIIVLLSGCLVDGVVDIVDNNVNTSATLGFSTDGDVNGVCDQLSFRYNVCLEKDCRYEYPHSGT